MKWLNFAAPILKGIVGICGFLIGIGWGAYAAISIMVKAEANVVEQKLMTVRSIDVAHIDKRFDRIEKLIKEER